MSRRRWGKAELKAQDRTKWKQVVDALCDFWHGKV